MSEKTTKKAIGSFYILTGFSGAGKSVATKDLEDAYYIYADSNKAFPFKAIHTNVYPYGAFRIKKQGKTINDIPAKAIEYTGMDDFKKQLISKLKAYKEIKGALPKTVVLDAITNLYKMVNDFIKQTTKNVYGSHSSDTARDIDSFMAWIQKTLISRGINVVFTAHAIPNRETGIVEIATSGSKSFENVGSFFGATDACSYIHVTDGARLISHKDLNYPTVCRNMLEDVADMEPIEDFDLQGMLDKLKESMQRDESMEL